MQIPRPVELCSPGVQADVGAPCFLAPSAWLHSISVQPKAVAFTQICITQAVAHAASIPKPKGKKQTKENTKPEEKRAASSPSLTRPTCSRQGIQPSAPRRRFSADITPWHKEDRQGKALQLNSEASN